MSPLYLAFICIRAPVHPSRRGGHRAPRRKTIRAVSLFPLFFFFPLPPPLLLSFLFFLSSAGRGLDGVRRLPEAGTVFPLPGGRETRGERVLIFFPLPLPLPRVL